MYIYTASSQSGITPLSAESAPKALVKNPDNRRNSSTNTMQEFPTSEKGCIYQMRNQPGLAARSLAGSTRDSGIAPTLRKLLVPVHVAPTRALRARSYWRDATDSTMP